MEIILAVFSSNLQNRLMCEDCTIDKLLGPDTFEDQLKEVLLWVLCLYGIVENALRVKSKFIE